MAVLTCLMLLFAARPLTCRPATKVPLIEMDAVVRPGQSNSLGGTSDDGSPDLITSVININNGVCPPILCQETDSTGTPIGESRNVKPFFEGDIVLTDDQKKKMTGSTARRKREIVADEVLLWPNAVVPYTVDDTLDSLRKKNIKAAHQHIMERTCIHFRQKTARDADYIRYVDEPGCWSRVGRVSGEQLIGLGSNGCEYLGIIIHETAHTLGFWHEQSRVDRDRYVKIHEDRMTAQGRENSGVLNLTISHSLNYTYDYRSIMHYGPFYFTANGAPTIEVIGIGKKLGLKIGNREGLSELDVAQLRDMYRCNRQPVSKQLKTTDCPYGWFRVSTSHSTSCVSFMFSEQPQSRANLICQRRGAHLAHIDTPEKLQVLKNSLVYYSSKGFRRRKPQFIWRLGAKRIDGKMYWYSREGRDLKLVQGLTWKEGHPGRYSTVGAEVDPSTGRVQLIGLWAGSKTKHAYPFICEKELQTRTCEERRAGDDVGRYYRGTIDFTRSGFTCQRWDSIYPQINGENLYGSVQGRNEGIGRHAYCRNPGGKKTQPWCYISSELKEWDYCHVNFCS